MRIVTDNILATGNITAINDTGVYPATNIVNNFVQLPYKFDTSLGDDVITIDFTSDVTVQDFFISYTNSPEIYFEMFNATNMSYGTVAVGSYIKLAQPQPGVRKITIHIAVNLAEAYTYLGLAYVGVGQTIGEYAYAGEEIVSDSLLQATANGQVVAKSRQQRYIHNWILPNLSRADMLTYAGIFAYGRFIVCAPTEEQLEYTAPFLGVVAGDPKIEKKNRLYNLSVKIQEAK